MLIGADTLIMRPDRRGIRSLDAIIGRGEDVAATAFANRHGLPYWRLEYGFLRCLGAAAGHQAPLSVVLDDRGIYFDSRSSSRLEALLAGADGFAPLGDPTLLDRARSAMTRIVDCGLTRTNDHPVRPLPGWLRSGRKRVLVIDQPRNADSVRLGRASARSFEIMLAAARAEHPGAEILIKTHPRTSGRLRGHLDRIRDERTRIVSDGVNPIELVRAVAAVYAVTSQLGFEALLAGKPVSCFGAPFYAGWGLTDDRVQVPRRTRRRSLEEVFAAAYLLYARYVDPNTGGEGTLEQVIDHLALQREQFARNQGRIFCFGFNHWKHNFVRAYLRAPDNQVTFFRDASVIEKRGFDARARLVVWGQKATQELREIAIRHNVPIWQMEDGFLRSVGLGSNLEAPASLVVDRLGVYYDPTRPSELEQILQHGNFMPDELDRARCLRDAIVRARLSKYNVGRQLPIEVPPGRRIVLVPGQVEDDASIQLGCRDIRTNEALLREARRQRPDAFIIFKPHPDVVSGNRTGMIAPARARALADHVEEGASLPDCLAVADEVHTLTSLVGFEALLRDKMVVVYGQPFYAGWGLTEDRHPVTRRTRRLELDELVTGTLIRYPRYINLRTGRFTTPEAVIAHLQHERDSNPAAQAVRIWGPRRQLRRLVQALRGMLHAP